MENNKPTNEIQVELSEEMAQERMQIWQLYHILHPSSYWILSVLSPRARSTGEKPRHYCPDNRKTTFVRFAG